MILKSVCAKWIGPFDGSSSLELDDNVTVITGPNDVGKTLLLRTIQLACTSQSLSEAEANIDRYGESKVRWQQDDDISIAATFKLSEAEATPRGVKNLSPDSVLNLVRKPAPEVSKTRATIPGSVWSTNDFQEIAAIMPKVLYLPSKSYIRQVIPLDAMNEAEAAFVRLAFGQGFSIAKHEALPQHLRSFAIRAAEHKVNKRAEEILPANVGMRFAICENGGKPKELALALIDKHEGFAPVESRGAGIRKLVDVMGHLLEIDPNNGHSIVLYDEPETSLHADAQHAIRRCLEKIAEHAKIQVVYTTHSPAMINTYRPASIRVLDRSHVRDRAITTIRNQAFDGNYAKIRASLGISPSDSLLYCPITVVCEGATEIRCMQIVFDKLAELGTIDKTELMDLMSMVHFLDGEGSSMEYMCRLAESQRSRVIVFHDGDNTNEVNDIRIRHPDAHIVVLPVGTEFEEIVPCERYFNAFAALQGEEEVPVSAEDFKDWRSKANLKTGTLFSKEVNRYAFERGVGIPSKHQVMAKSITLADPSEICSTPFEELFRAIKACAVLV